MKRLGSCRAFFVGMGNLGDGMKVQELLKELDHALGPQGVNLEAIWNIAMMLESEANTDGQRKAAKELKQASTDHLVRVKASAVRSAFRPDYDDRGFPIASAFNRSRK